MAFFSRWVSIFVDDQGIFVTGDDSERTATLGSGFYVDIEHPLRALRPGHRCPVLWRRLALPFPFRVALAALSSLGRRDLTPVFALGRKHPLLGIA
jgi:hypothetical protein